MPTASALGRRLDFEVARALEWRDGEFVPLPGSAVGAERMVRAAHDDAARRPAELVALRASYLLARHGVSPGTFAVGTLRVLIGLACVLALAAGWRLALTALGEPGAGPVNLVRLLAQCLGVQLLFLGGSLAFMVLARRRGGPAAVSGAALGRLLLRGAARAATWRATRRRRDAGEIADVVAARLRGAAGLAPLAFTASHLAWTTFNLGLLLGLSLTLTAQHHSFAWQSTFIEQDATAEQVLVAALLPSAVFPGLPTTAQVRASRYDPETHRFVQGPGDGASALALGQRWSLQLLAAIIGWGLLPRLGLLHLALGAWRRGSGAVDPADDDPYASAVLESAFPRVHARSAAPEPVPDDPEAGRTARRKKRGRLRKGDRQWLAASWLSAAEGRDPTVALWGAASHAWTSLARLAGRQAEGAAVAAVAALPEPRGVVILCDYSVTPDAAFGRALTELREALGRSGRLAVALTGGEAFRQSRRGQAPGAVPRRREVWTEALVRSGLKPGDLVDLDPDSATPAARNALAMALEIEPPSPSGPLPGEAMEAALQLVEDAAEGWEKELLAEDSDARDAARLRLSAAVRLAVDDCFGVNATTPTVGASPSRSVTAAGAALGRCFRLPEESRGEALEQAAASLAGMARVLARVRRLDPRFVAAGFAAGFLAGPLAGAVAAGTAGLVAGVSLASTLGALGAALGGAVSWQFGRGGPATRPANADDHLEDEDLLGLPTRTAVVRALVLAWQANGEPAVAEVLDRFASHPMAARRVDDVLDVHELTEAARSVGAPP